jgi:cell division protein FtsI/penicillin-binding protein 2
MSTKKINRYQVVSLLIFAFIAILFVRLFYLQIYKHNFYAAKSKRQVEKIIRIPPTRGTIYDRHQRPIALTEVAYSAYANPREVTSDIKTAQILAKTLNLPQADLVKKLSRNQQFTWIARKISEEDHATLTAHKLAGIYFFKDEKRVYPNAQLAGDIIGFTGIDNQGLSGLEYKYDPILKGKEGKLLFNGDARRNRLITSEIHTITQPEDGQSIITTLDTIVQFITEKHLQEGAKKAGAQSAQAIVMDPYTGDILALADYPSFDPNTWTDYPNKIRKNSCISDVLEPGSIFKIFTLAAAIEEGLITSQSVLTVPETITLYTKTIKEAHGRPKGESDRKTVSEILEKSLNVGTTIITSKLSNEKLYQYMTLFGFGKPTGIELPAESTGIFRHYKRWSGLDNATLSFGQGIGITPIQMVTAASIIANGGYHIKPRIVEYTISKDTKTLKGIPKSSKGQIFKPDTMQQVRDMMISVVDKGTGINTQIAGFVIGGKTGTAQKAKENGRGYEAGKYVASFVGFFPYPNPKAVILVAVQSPEGLYYGSQVAGPIFKNITEDLIRHWNLDPTRPIPPPPPKKKP